MKPSFKPLLIIFISIFCINANAQLKGNYTIDKNALASATNYVDFNSAVGDLEDGKRGDGGTPNGAGISGAVIFNIANGTYAEHIAFLKKIKGTSDTNRIIFQSASGDSSKVILDVAINSVINNGNSYGLILKKTSYISFKKLTITRSDTSAISPAIPVVICLDTVAYISFEHCVLRGEFKKSWIVSGITTISEPFQAALGHDVSFINNYIIGGYKGINLYKNADNSIINNNVFDSISEIELDVLLAHNVTVSGNTSGHTHGVMTFGDITGMSLVNNKFDFTVGGHLFLVLCFGTKDTP